MRPHPALSVDAWARSTIAVAALWLWLGACVPLAAQSDASNLIGVVQDSTGHGVPHAQLRVKGTTYVGLSDSVGYFAIGGIPSGNIKLEVRALGFYPTEQAVELRSGQLTRATVVLVPWECVSLECEGIQVVPSSADSVRR